MPEIPLRAFIVSVVAVRQVGRDWQVLLMQRTQSLAGEWCQIAGKIEEGETAWQAGLRELLEETGLVPTAYYSADIMEQFYEADRDALTFAPVFLAQINPDDPVVLNEEHSAFDWLSFNDATNRVAFGGQRRVLRWIYEEFIERTPSEHLRIPFE